MRTQISWEPETCHLMLQSSKQYFYGDNKDNKTICPLKFTYENSYGDKTEYCRFYITVHNALCKNILQRSRILASTTSSLYKHICCIRKVFIDLCQVILVRYLSVVKICVCKKILWKYMLYCLNNENCCLNNTTKQASF